MRLPWMLQMCCMKFRLAECLVNRMLLSALTLLLSVRTVLKRLLIMRLSSLRISVFDFLVSRLEPLL